MELYTAFDLHANNSYAAIIDGDGRKVAGKKLDNDPQVVLNFLETHREAMKGIVVESTFNWYWLVDNLMTRGYKVHLANTTAIQKYNGLKHCGDKEDAF
jgi:transposase